MSDDVDDVDVGLLWVRDVEVDMVYLMSVEEFLRSYGF